MKLKQRVLAIVLLCSTLIIMGIVQIIAGYVDNVIEIITRIPDDLGEQITDTEFVTTLTKFYIKSNLNNNSTSINLTYAITNNTTSTERENDFVKIYDNYYIHYNLFPNNRTDNCIVMSYSSFNYESNETMKQMYVPIYICNARIYNAINCEIYKSTTIDEETIRQEAYQLGFTNGYNDGYNEGYPQGFNEAQGLKQDLNIVQHIEQLIAQFTGNEYAKYITPIALVLTILMIYFLFIRFLLSLMKAKGVIKTCDILMIVACIIVLVCMYMPMIKLEITQHQIIEQVETTSSNVYQVNSDITYYTYTDDQGNTIHGGPGGTYIEYVETTRP
jgi:hypothetical protein